MKIGKELNLFVTPLKCLYGKVLQLNFQSSKPISHLNKFFKLYELSTLQYIFQPSAYILWKCNTDYLPCHETAKPHGEFTLLANYSNPNRRFGVRFESFHIELLHSDRLVCWQTMQPLTQRPREKSLQSVTFDIKLRVLTTRMLVSNFKGSWRITG